MSGSPEADGRPEVLLVAPVLERLDTALDQNYRLHRLYDAADPARLLADVGPRVRAAVVTGGSGLPDHLWAALPALELIAVFGVGTDKVDLPQAKARGVAVTITEGVLTEDVADLAMALWLAAVRRIPVEDRYVRDGAWERGDPLPLTGSATGSRVGILGLGAIGQAIAVRAAPFARSIAYHSRKPVEGSAYTYFDTAEGLARESDVLFVSVSGGPHSRNLVDRKVIEALGPAGILVNIARGLIIDEPEMLAALQEGRLGAAALDVFVDEPHVPAGFMSLDNVVLLPHRGSATQSTRAGMADSVLNSVNAHFAGRP